jgi:hypothetical protein
MVSPTPSRFFFAANFSVGLGDVRPYRLLGMTFRVARLFMQNLIVSAAALAVPMRPTPSVPCSALPADSF